MRKLFLVVFIMLPFVACERDNSNSASDESGPRIQWFTGTMEQALEKAKSSDKALFVYWGATWCPPCNLLKSTVFKDPTFVEATKKFIAVFLDGDNESSQQWGEKLKASGYPTIMVLNPKGEEVVRLTTTLPAKSLAATLDAAYERLDPIEEVVTRILAKAAKDVTPDDWKYLSHYSWTQDEVFKSKKGKLTDVLAKLEAKVPANMPEERSRLYMNYLVTKVGELEKNQKLPKNIREQGNKRIQEILENVSLVKYNLEFLAYYSADLIKGLYPDANALRDAVIGNYKAALEAVRKELPVGEYDRMVTYYPAVDLNELMTKNQGLNEDDKTKIKEEMLKANLMVKDDHSRIFTSNTSTYILYKAGMGDIARQILQDDLKKGVNDYYTMSSLSWIEKQSGNAEKAVEWSEKAYKAAKGSATKIQWGAKHISNLLEMYPKEKQKIIDQLDNYLSADLNVHDAFLGRNKAQLDKLSEKVKDWKNTQKTGVELAGLKKKYMTSCKRDADKKTKYYVSDCENYFKKLL